MLVGLGCAQGNCLPKHVYKVKMMGVILLKINAGVHLWAAAHELRSGSRMCWGPSDALLLPSGAAGASRAPLLQAGKQHLPQDLLALPGEPASFSSIRYNVQMGNAVFRGQAISTTGKQTGHGKMFCRETRNPLLQLPHVHCSFCRVPSTPYRINPLNALYPGQTQMHQICSARVRGTSSIGSEERPLPLSSSSIVPIGELWQLQTSRSAC